MSKRTSLPHAIGSKTQDHRLRKSKPAPPRRNRNDRFELYRHGFTKVDRPLRRAMVKKCGFAALISASSKRLLDPPLSISSKCTSTPKLRLILFSPLLFAKEEDLGCGISWTASL